jgi:ribose transport system substrate-binding protein
MLTMRTTRILTLSSRAQALCAVIGLVCLASVVAAQPRSRPIKSVAVTLAEDGGPYYEQIVRGAEQGTRAIDPQITFTAVTCKNNAETQMQQIDGFVAAGVDLILIQRSYAGDSSPAVQRARHAGVTVVALDVDIPGGTDALVKPDEQQGGTLAGRYVSQRLNGHGKVAIANGPATSGPLKLRVAGFIAELKKSPGIEIVEDQNTGMSRDGTRAVMAGYLSRHADLDAVFGVNDPVAYYCELEALAHPDHKRIVIVGMEGSPRSVEAMKDPQRLIEASPGADPFALAERGVQLGAAVRRGQQAVGVIELMPFVELSRANAATHRGWTH